MPMKNVTSATVEQVRRQSADTAACLLANQQRLQQLVDPLLARWNDAHVQAYFQTAEAIADNIRRYNAVLDKIEGFCRDEQNWIRAYLET